LTQAIHRRKLTTFVLSVASCHSDRLAHPRGRVSPNQISFRPYRQRVAPEMLGRVSTCVVTGVRRVPGTTGGGRRTQSFWGAASLSWST
jgi:hypothetical protein